MVSVGLVGALVGSMFLSAPASATTAYSGYVSTVAGSGTEGYSAGPVATSAAFGKPIVAVADNAGNTYVSDALNCMIRKVDRAGLVTIIAGTTGITNGQCGYSADGTATSMSLGQAAGLALDSAGTTLFFTDDEYCLVRKLNLGTGAVTTIGGLAPNPNPRCGWVNDSTSEFSPTEGIALDSSGNVYVADVTNCVIRKLASPSYSVSTIAGVGGSCGNGGSGGSATSTQIGMTFGVAVDRNGDLYLTDSGNDVIHKVSGGTITTIAGSAGHRSYNGDGTATSSYLNGPGGIAVDNTTSTPTIFFSDTNNCRVRKVTGTSLTTVLGNGTCAYNGDGAAGTNVEVNVPGGVSMTRDGDLLVGDQNNDRVRVLFGAGTPLLSAAANPSGGSASNVAANQILRVYGDGNSGNNWTAGDATYTLRLADGRTIWLFGDSFLGTISSTDHSRSGATTMIANQMLLQNSGSQSLSNVWINGTGNADFVPPANRCSPNNKYWPSAAIQTGTSPVTVQVVLRCNSAGLAVADIDLATLTESGGSWSVSYDTTNFTTNALRSSTCTSGTASQIQFGTALTTVAGSTYIYGIENCPSDGMFGSGYVHVAKVSGTDLTATWTYMGNDSTSGAGTSAPGARLNDTSSGSSATLIHAGAEYSVVYDANESTYPYRLVTSDLGVGHIYRYVSANPYGPWRLPAGLSGSTKVDVWSPPENGAAAYRQANGCVLYTYGGKEHYELADPDRLVVSYNVNVKSSGTCNTLSTISAQLNANTDNYRPRFIDITDAN